MVRTLFPAVVNMSITASLAILVVLLARVLLKPAPRIYSYVLWAVVLFRLLCPVSLTSDLSLWNALSVPTTETGSLAYVTFQGSGPEMEEHSGAGTALIPDQGTAPAGNPSLAPSAPADPITPLAVLSLIWLCGAGGILAVSLWKLLVLRRNLIGAVPLEGKVYLADHIPTPFVLGLIRPRIYLPSDLTGPEQSYIIRHEAHHIRRGDHIFKLLAFLALCLHWFNPLVWLAYRLFSKDMEMSCDEAVMKQMDGDVRAAYSMTLLRWATDRKAMTGMPLAFGEGDTKERIENIMKYKRPVLWVGVLSLILCLGLSACLSSNPNPDNEDPIYANLAGEHGSTLQDQLYFYLSGPFDEAYDPYYEGLRYEMSGYTETIDGENFTATFLWTMYHLDSGGDISGCAGIETESNFYLQATGTVDDDGVVKTLEFLGDVSVNGPSDYSAPLESYFPGENSRLTLVGTIQEVDLQAQGLLLDQGFWLTQEENAALLQELGVTQEALSDGFYFYNPEPESRFYPISDQAVFRVFEIREDQPWTLAETTLETFAEDLNKRTTLYTVVVQNGEIVELSEQYVP